MRPTFKILCPTLTYVTRATAELPSFHGVGRKKLLAWPTTQVQSGVVALSTPENQQAVDGDKQRDRLSTGLPLFRLDLKESGYKVAWIEKPLLY